MAENECKIDGSKFFKLYTVYRKNYDNSFPILTC